MGVSATVGTDGCVAVGGASVGSLGVLLGGTLVVGGTEVCVSVGKSGMTVTPGTGVRVGMFGT